jgi:phenylpropionate dioxygenase-like ring-hydroxylating dioxygenase large terminal subunit
VGQNDAMVRPIPDPDGISQARTLPAASYADGDRFVLERERIFRKAWVCAAALDDLPPAGSWTSITIGGWPVLLIVDKEGAVRAFLNVCRHRAAPLCDEGVVGHGSLVRCPYHAWLYRLDGTLARASGVGAPEGFDTADYSLAPVRATVWRRWLFVCFDPDAPALDLGALGAAVDPYPIEALEPVLRESHVRRFNWKVLLENYSENYHTPFVHPEIDTSSSEDYPMVSDGLVLYAWDRPLQPADETGRIMAELLPGEPGWEHLAMANSDRPYGVGSYLTVWPNLMVNVFPDAVLAMWMEPLSPNTTRVERRLYAAAGTDAATRDSIIEAHRLVHDQDIEICTMVQRSHDAGLDANGVLATVEERGVYFVHQHLRAALGGVTW